MGREVIHIHTSDMVVIVGGLSGTPDEFAIAYEDGKLIGVLEGSGGMTDEISAMIEHIGKDTGAQLIYETRQNLLENMQASNTNRHFPKPSSYCNEIMVR